MHGSLPTTLRLLLRGQRLGRLLGLRPRVLVPGGLPAGGQREALLPPPGERFVLEPPPAPLPG